MTNNHSMTDPTQTDLKLRIFSHNIQGLNSPVKRHKIMQQLHTLKADVALLQETHFPATYNPTFLHKNFTHFHLANAVTKQEEWQFASQTKYTSPI